MTDYLIQPLFSTPIYVCEDVEYRVNESEKNCINSILTSLAYNDNLMMSNDAYVLRNLALRNILKLCQKHLNIYTKEVLRIQQDFYITNSWITAKNKGQGHHKHNHQNCIFSGVFYINATENMGGLTFHDKQGYLSNFNFGYSYDDFNIYNSSSWQFPVKTGTLIIFPSHLTHSADKNEDDGTRIVIGFNSFVSGSFGMEEDALYCSQLSL